MRGVIWRVLSAALIAVVLAGCASTKDANVIIVSGNPSYPPVSWKKDNTLIGVGPDVCKTIFKRLGEDCNVVYEGDWAQIQEATKKGEVDVIVAAYKNREREEYMDYSVPYISDPVVIFVKQGREFKFKSWKDLVGKKGVTGVGESYGQEMDEIIKTKLDVKRASMKECFNMLLDEKDPVRYVIAGKFPGVLGAKYYNVFHRIKYLPTPFTVQNFYVTFSKKSKFKNLLPEFNEKLNDMKKSGEVQTLIQEDIAKWEEAFLNKL